LFDDPAGRQQAVVEDCAAEAVIEYRFVFVDGILIGTKIIKPVVKDVLPESRMLIDVSRSLLYEG
jgi:hypothetical protein